MAPDYSLFINGEFKDSINKQDLINPSSGEVIANVPVADKEDAELAIESARGAFDEGEWPKLSLRERKNFLFRISQGILDRAGDLAKLETLNTGKPIKESTFMDVPSSAKTFEYFANHLEEYLKESAIDISSETKARLTLEPRGVVVLIVPWNYPLLIASWKMAQGLAAGNTVILKPSSLTPLSSLELAKIVSAAGLPKGSVNIISGPGEKIGEVLCSDKRVDMISFTGSNSVGKKILEYSSRNVKKTIMELGGKSASVILKDADLEAAVNGSLSSIFLNQGQMCTAMSRIFVQDEIYDSFIKDFINKAKRIRLGTGMDYETQMGPLISQTQRGKVIDFVERAKQQGAKLLCGGKIPENPSLKNGFFFEPAIFEGVTPEMAVFQEEVFGPVVCVSRFSEIEEAVKQANNSDFGLAASIWTKDLPQAEGLAARINAGIIWTNTYGMFYNELPYGGFKQSGFGKELGRDGFLEYSRLKNVIVEKNLDTKPLVSYWYGF